MRINCPLNHSAIFSCTASVLVLNFFRFSCGNIFRIEFPSLSLSKNIKKRRISVVMRLNTLEKIDPTTSNVDPATD